MMKSKDYSVYYILFLIFLLLIVGCKNQNTTISILEYNRLTTIETRYNELTQNYTDLQIQCNLSITERDDEIRNISDILHNKLRYEKPITIFNPLKLKMQVWDYPTPTKIANTSIYGAFIIDFILTLGFFLAERGRRKLWILSIILVTLFIGISLLWLWQIS